MGTRKERLPLRVREALDFLPDDDLGQLRDHLPDDLLDDLARQLGDGLVLGAAGGDGRHLLGHRVRDDGGGRRGGRGTRGGSGPGGRGGTGVHRRRRGGGRGRRPGQGGGGRRGGRRSLDGELAVVVVVLDGRRLRAAGLPHGRGLRSHRDGGGDPGAVDLGQDGANLIDEALALERLEQRSG